MTTSIHHAGCYTRTDPAITLLLPIIRTAIQDQPAPPPHRWPTVKSKGRHDAGKITTKHGEIKTLKCHHDDGVPGEDASLMDKVKAGDKVRFLPRRQERLRGDRG
jgi:Cu/Ag efflux protein CusF